MSLRNRTRTVLLLVLSFACYITIGGTSIAQMGGIDNVASVQPASQGWQLSDQSALPAYPATTCVDPIAALSAKVDALQQQLDAISLSGSCCDDGSTSTCSSGGFYGGAGVVFVKPHFKEAFQHSSTSVLSGRQSLVPFEYDYEAVPRAWLGYKRQDGLGFRFSFMDFQADGQTRINVADGLNVYGAHAVSIIFPANILAAIPGETLQNTDSLKAQVYNYLGTYDTSFGGIDVNGGVGLRNARLEQNLDSVVLNPVGAPIRQLSWQRVFEGLGPTATIEAKRRLGCSPFSAITQVGGALLFGKKSLNRTVFGDQSPQPATPFLSLDEADEVIGMGELNFGVEWNRQLASGYNLGIRGIYEGQLWAEAGAPTLGFLGFEGFGILAELKR